MLLVPFLKSVCILSPESTSGSSDIPLVCHFCNSSRSCSTRDFKNLTCNSELSFCYTIWTNNSGNVSITSKGCWIQNNGCDQSACSGDLMRPERNMYFCCCNRNFCNRNVSVATKPVDKHSRSPFTPSKWQCSTLVVVSTASKKGFGLVKFQNN